ncbi:MAG: diacylglycerol O-acyltransferase / wax synthase [Solirubrobacterales bacterium]|jgi:WS/DGAT/MGAT family acyltransferase|nr:diacylglycerol O-acyltransferase / wax synthase [Solirubrobacterales bacterium]
MQRLSTLDTSFLRVETPSAHMHVGWLATLELPDGVGELDPAKLTERIAARLHLAPRFRQLVAPAPLGEPIWVDDPGFRLDRHVTVATEPVRGRRDLERLAGGFLSQQLDRRRPLWQIVVVPRAGPGRAAVLGKVHHAMVDGIAAVELGTLLFDLAPDAALPEPGDWEPEPAEAPLRIAVDALADSALEQFRAARRVASMGIRPRTSLRVAETMRRAALSLAEDVIRPAGPSFLNAEIGPRRALVTERVSLARLDRIKRAREVKLNDVVLAVVSGTLRRYAALVEAEPQRLRAMVPVSVRAAADAPAEGNRITFAFIDLPLDEPDPARRLALVCERTGELKRSGRIAGSDALLRSMVQLPGFLKERAARLAASPRMYNLAVSNVPGPRVSLYAAGALVESIHPVIPTSDGHAIAIGVLTYRESLHFSAYVDPDVLPEAAELGQLFRQSVSELEHAVGRGRGRSRSRVPSAALVRA